MRKKKKPYTWKEHKYRLNGEDLTLMEISVRLPVTYRTL